MTKIVYPDYKVENDEHSCDVCLKGKRKLYYHLGGTKGYCYYAHAFIHHTYKICKGCETKFIKERLMAKIKELETDLKIHTRLLKSFSKKDRFEIEELMKKLT